jgi:YD repeat-containing protein
MHHDDYAHLVGAAVDDGHRVGAPIDANGNLTSDGTRTFAWIARNELVKITIGTDVTEYAYDGTCRKVRRTNPDGLVTYSIWCGSELCREFDLNGVRALFSRGARVGEVSEYWTFDHLGSVRDATESSGALRSRAEYSPYGGMSQTFRGFAHQGGVASYRTHDHLVGLHADDRRDGRWHLATQRLIASFAKSLKVRVMCRRRN